MILNFMKSGCRKVKEALNKTRSILASSIKNLIGEKIDENSLEKLEELFYEIDLGIKTSHELVEKVKELYKKQKTIDEKIVLEEMKKATLNIMGERNPEIEKAPLGTPTIIFVVGVNGNGKTTSVAKLAKKFKDEGKNVLLAAADTFRAAATEQLEIWAKHIGVNIIKGKEKSDPSAIVFDAINAAKARNIDILLIDTAGRLHTKTNLMQELAKMKKVCQKNLDNSPHETLLVIDASVGQNAIDQANTFHQYTPITGLILTKLDGTAKGGITVSIQRELGIPIKFIGTGENIKDLISFNARDFVSALFE